MLTNTKTNNKWIWIQQPYTILFESFERPLGESDLVLPEPFSDSSLIIFHSDIIFFFHRSRRTTLSIFILVSARTGSSTFWFFFTLSVWFRSRSWCSTCFLAWFWERSCSVFPFENLDFDFWSAITIKFKKILSPTLFMLFSFRISENSLVFRTSIIY